MKSYHEQKYPISIDVLVELEGNIIFEDSIKGLNRGHALYLAHQNWSAIKSIEVRNVNKLN